MHSRKQLNAMANTQPQSHYRTFSGTDENALSVQTDDGTAADAYYKSWPNIDGSLMYHSSPLSSRRRRKPGEIMSPLLGREGGDDDTVGECNFFQASFNAVNLLLGVGVLSLPFAVRTSGWLIAVPLLAVLSIITNYTGKLLGRCIDYHPPAADRNATVRFRRCFPNGIRTYPDIGEAAFGKRGRLFISVIFFTELFCACCMYLILMGDNLATLFPGSSSVHFILISACVVLPTTWTSHLTILSYTSLLGIIASLFLMVVLVYAGLSSPANEVVGGSLTHPQPTVLVAPLDRVPLVLGLVMVGFAGHACFPSVYCSMRNRQQFPSVLNLTYAVTGTIYMLVAVAGYLMFGNLTAQEVTVNLVQSHPGTLSALATWLLVINPSTKFALTLYPVSTSVEDLLLPRLRSASTFVRTLAQIVIRTLLTAGVTLIAVSVPSFARVVSFIGAFCSFVVSGAFPPACYLKLYSDQLSWGTTALNKTLVVVCSICSVIGTLAAILCPTN